MTKFEIVITAWEDRMFKGRKRIEFEYDGATYPSLEDISDEMVKKIYEEKAKWNKIMEDGDIPF